MNAMNANSETHGLQSERFAAHFVGLLLMNAQDIMEYFPELS
jgi:hypothetical protein